MHIIVVPKRTFFEGVGESHPSAIPARRGWWVCGVGMLDVSVCVCVFIYACLLSSELKCDKTRDNYQPNKIKWNFFRTALVSILVYGCTTWMLIKRLEKKLDRNCTIMLGAIVNNFWSNIPRINSYMATYLLSLKPSKKMNKTCRTLLEKQQQSNKGCSSMNSYIWTCQCWPTSKNLSASAQCKHSM